MLDPWDGAAGAAPTEALFEQVQVGCLPSALLADAKGAADVYNPLRDQAPPKPQAVGQR